MKKCISVFLVCMMIVTGFSLPVFANNENDIKNLSEENVNELQQITNDVFEQVLEPQDGFMNCRGPLFDGICCSDLLAKYYNENGMEELAKEYLAKMHTLEAELMWWSLSERIECAQLEIYFLQRAVNDLKGCENEDLHEILSERLKSAKKNIKDFVIAKNLYPNIGIGEILNEVYKGVPKNEKEFKDLLDKADEIYHDLSDFLDYGLVFDDEICSNGECVPCSPESDSERSGEDEYPGKSNEKPCPPDESECKLNVDVKNQYKVKDVVRSVLKGNFSFGDSNEHIACGLLYKNEL